MDILRALPPVTRALLIGEALVTLPCVVHLLAPYDVALLWPLVTRKWQLWRIGTSFLYGGDGLPLLLNTFFFYRASSDLEAPQLLGDSADYAWALMLIGAAIVALNVPLRTPILFHPLLNALTYLWSVQVPNARVSIMGAVNVEAKYLPYVNLALDLVTGGPAIVVQSATGLVAAFLWNYVKRAPSAPRGGRRIGVGAGTDVQAFVARYLSPLLSTPTVVRRVLFGAPSNVRRTSYGTAYAPPPRGPAGRTTPQSNTATRRAEPDRSAILAATEARVRGTQ
ncbi:hypothetical protein MSPP1_002014 [Malassezia sp. CBS 17886]|nr:hypothetical protein MSPP1_002014 [Malassezia sp. CBS 17886]